jgi:hypothetical protein
MKRETLVNKQATERNILAKKQLDELVETLQCEVDNGYGNHDYGNLYEAFKLVLQAKRRAEDGVPLAEAVEDARGDLAMGSWEWKSVDRIVAMLQGGV